MPRIPLVTAQTAPLGQRESFDYENALKRTMVVLAGGDDKKSSPDHMRRKLQATIEFQETINKMLEASTPTKREEALTFFNGRYNSGYSDADDAFIRPLIVEANEYLRPKGIAAFGKWVQRVSPFLSDGFDEASDHFGMFPVSAYGTN